MASFQEAQDRERKARQEHTFEATGESQQTLMGTHVIKALQVSLAPPLSCMLPFILCLHQQKLPIGCCMKDYKCTALPVIVGRIAAPRMLPSAVCLLFLLYAALLPTPSCRSNPDLHCLAAKASCPSITLLSPAIMAARLGYVPCMTSPSMDNNSPFCF